MLLLSNLVISSLPFSDLMLLSLSDPASIPFLLQDLRHLNTFSFSLTQPCSFSFCTLLFCFTLFYLDPAKYEYFISRCEKPDLWLPWGYPIGKSVCSQAVLTRHFQFNSLFNGETWKWRHARGLISSLLCYRFPASLFCFLFYSYFIACSGVRKHLWGYSDFY